MGTKFVNPWVSQSASPKASRAPAIPPKLQDPVAFPSFYDSDDVHSTHKIPSVSEGKATSNATGYNGAQPSQRLTQRSSRNHMDTTTFRKRSSDAERRKSSKTKPHILPHFKKPGHREANNTFDLSVSAAENGIATHHSQAKDKRYGGDIHGGLSNGVGIDHQRSASGNSQRSNNPLHSTARPGDPYVHPMRQTPRPYTPPLSYSNQGSAPGSIYSDKPQFYTDLEDSRQKSNRDHHQQSSSLNSMPEPRRSIHLQTDSRTYLPTSSQPNVAGVSSTSRALDNTSARETISPISRSSLDFAFRSKSRNSTSDPVARAAAVQAARQAFEEKEAAKVRKQEEITLKAQDRELRRRERREQTGRPSLSDFTLRPPKLSEKVSPHRDASGHQHGAGQVHNAAQNNTQHKPHEQTYDSSTVPGRRNSRLKSPKSTWLLFLTWLRTRLFKFGKRLKNMR